MIMNGKFTQIAEFIEDLETQNVINDDEQFLMLVGGNSTGKTTNLGCINPGCTNPSDTRDDVDCKNVSCVNTGC